MPLSHLSRSISPLRLFATSPKKTTGLEATGARRCHCSSELAIVNSEKETESTTEEEEEEEKNEKKRNNAHHLSLSLFSLLPEHWKIQTVFARSRFSGFCSPSSLSRPSRNCTQVRSFVYQLCIRRKGTSRNAARHLVSVRSFTRRRRPLMGVDGHRWSPLERKKKPLLSPFFSISASLEALFDPHDDDS